MAETNIYANYKEFVTKAVWPANGVSPEFAEKFPNYADMNATNMNCWNCSECELCRSCIDCQDCRFCDHVDNGKECEFVSGSTNVTCVLFCETMENVERAYFSVGVHASTKQENPVYDVYFTEGSYFFNKPEWAYENEDEDE